ncbi:uncharacterized protein LOC129908234 [Episyrphus balteatus]|uniref:uncharacterized protein LOC129908234 n=1 Tax=Episyrphus balteatus TaxID=286459 RepID=UPI002485CEDD|nr:uncharacterized protein LOC129908234 [Episyrphus balteatus]
MKDYVTTLPPQNRNLENTEIDAAIDSLEIAITRALDSQKQPKTSKDRYQHLPEHVQNLYAHRQRLKKRLQRIHQRELNTSNPNYRTLWSELQCTNIMLRNSIQHFNNTQFQKRLQSIKLGPDAFKNINRIVGQKSPIPEFINTNNGEATTSQEKAEAFAVHFESNFTPNSSVVPVFLEEVEAFIQRTLLPNNDKATFSDSNPASEPTESPNLNTPEEIAEIINLSKPKKSAGPDGISNFIIKRLPETVIIFLAIILNNCINNCYFPQKWKTARIVAIPKKGARNIISNYRPISLLNNLSKLLEELTLRKLKEVLQR